MHTKLKFFVGAIFIILGLFVFFRFVPEGTTTLWNISKGGVWLFPLVSVSALLDSINPCAFSILILTIAFLFSLQKPRKEIIKVGGVYVAGLFLVYVMIGLGILGTLHIFNTPHFMAKVGAVLLILLGSIELLGALFPAFPLKLHIPQASHRTIARLMEKATYPAAFILGILVGLCEFPCTGGPYLMVLGLLHDHATYLKGFLYLLYYNLIFILPLVVILGVVSDEKVLQKIKDWKTSNIHRMRIWGGVLAVLFGILIFLL